MLDLQGSAPVQRGATSGPFLDTVDTALGGYLTPTLEHLSISLYADDRGRPRVPARRIAPWLQFAAEHVVGELSLCLRVPHWFLYGSIRNQESEAVLELPDCERARQIELSLTHAWRGVSGPRRPACSRR